MPNDETVSQRENACAHVRLLSRCKFHERARFFVELYQQRGPSMRECRSESSRYASGDANMVEPCDTRVSTHQDLHLHHIPVDTTQGKDLVTRNLPPACPPNQRRVA